MGYDPTMPTLIVEQVSAARVFLGWSQHDLSDASGLSFEAIRNFERDERSATAAKARQSCWRNCASIGIE